MPTTDGRQRDARHEHLCTALARGGLSRSQLSRFVAACRARSSRGSDSCFVQQSPRLKRYPRGQLKDMIPLPCGVRPVGDRRG
jgi:hypothetical protein